MRYPPSNVKPKVIESPSGRTLHGFSLHGDQSPEGSVSDTLALVSSAVELVGASLLGLGPDSLLVELSVCV